MGKHTKILFTDLDGTLLNDQKEVTAGNQAAIDWALEQGHKIVVTTGRPLASGVHIAERIGLTREGCYVTAFNGGQIYDPFHKKTIYGKTISTEVAKPLFQEALNRGLHVQSYSDTSVLAMEDRPELHYYIDRSTVPYEIVPDVDAAFPFDPYKILLVGLDNRSELEKYQRECVDPLKGTVRSFFSTEYYLEVAPEGVSKGFAVKWMCDHLGIDQPRWKELTSLEDIYTFVDEVGFPLLIRPSYVLSGAAMNVVSNREELVHFLELAAEVSKDHPVVVTEFIEQAKEVEIDAVAQHGEIKAYAISEHVEFAGVHSGDATIVFPAQKLYVETMRRIKRIARAIAKELNISGPFNMQFLAKDNDIKVIECNLRASRSFPFVSKVLKYNFIEMATRIMLGEHVAELNKSVFDLDYVGVKASQFSFARLLKADPVLGVDMSSTGEVGCIGENYYEAILKSMISVGNRIPEKNILISSGPSRSKVELLNSTKMLIAKGYHIFATAGTAKFFEENGIRVTILHWPDEEKEPNIMDYLRNKKIDMVINIPKNHTKRELDNGYKIRRAAVDYNIPLITNARLASAFIYAICKVDRQDIAIKSWDEYK